MKKYKTRPDPTKKYISRPEAVKKYRIGYSTIKRWEANGELEAYKPQAVGYGKRSNQGGLAPKWVYDEDVVARLAQKTGRDVSLVKRSRTEAQAFVLLEKGASVVDLVKELLIDMTTARHIREVYEREKDGVTIVGEVVRAIRALGFSFTPDNASITVMGLIEEIRALSARLGRADKPPPEHVKYIPEDDDDDDDNES